MSASLRVDHLTLTVDQSACLRIDATEEKVLLAVTVDAISADSLILRLPEDQPPPPWVQAGSSLELVVIDRNGLHRGSVSVLRLLDVPCRAAVVTTPRSIKTTQNRQAIRISTKLSATYIVVSASKADNVGKQDTQAFTYDLSAGGVRLLSRVAVEVGDRIRIQLNTQLEDSAVQIRIPPNTNVAGFRGLAPSIRPTGARQPSVTNQNPAAGGPSARQVATVGSPSIRNIAVSQAPATRAGVLSASRIATRGVPSQKPVIALCDDFSLELEAEVMRVEPSAQEGEYWIAGRFCELGERTQTRLVRLVNELQRKERAEQG